MRLIRYSVIVTSVAAFLFSAATMPSSAGAARELRLAEMTEAALELAPDLEADENGDGVVDVLDIQFVAGAPREAIPTEPDSEGETPAAPAQAQPTLVQPVAVALSVLDVAPSSNKVDSLSAIDLDAVPASTLYWRYCRVPHGPPLSALS